MNTLGSNSGPNNASTRRQNVAGALVNPKGMAWKWYKTVPSTEKAVYFLLAEAIATCKYAFFKSIFDDLQRTSRLVVWVPYNGMK